MLYSDLTIRWNSASMTGSHMDIVEEREHRGWSRKELAQKAGVSYSLLSVIERGERPCTERTGTAIALALDVRPRDLSPPGGRAPSSSVEWNCECVSLETIDTEPGYEQEFCTTDLRETLLSLLKGLHYREECIIKLRFGFEGRSLTLEEIGNMYGVSRERIRQVEAQALGKLRHPLRTRKVREYV